MRQISFANQASFEKYARPSRREQFLDTMETVVPWAELEALIAPYYPKAGNGRQPIGLSIMLRVLLSAAVVQPVRPRRRGRAVRVGSAAPFHRVDLGRAAAPDESTILNFRHLLEQHALCGKILDTVNLYLASMGIRIGTGTIVDATIINAPSSTKNATGKRDPEMHQTRKGNQYYFGAKAHIGVDSKQSVVHSYARLRLRCMTCICCPTYCTARSARCGAMPAIRDKRRRSARPRRRHKI